MIDSANCESRHYIFGIDPTRLRNEAGAQAFRSAIPDMVQPDLQVGEDSPGPDEVSANTGALRIGLTYEQVRLSNSFVGNY